MTDYPWDNFEKPETSGLTQRGGSGWFITTTSASGKLIVLGPYSSEDEASSYGFQKLGSNFDVHWYPTRDMNKATRMAKKEQLDTTRNLEASIQRARHKI